LIVINVYFVLDCWIYYLRIENRGMTFRKPGSK